VTEYDKLKASAHYSTLRKVEAAVEVSVAALASDSDQDDVRRYIDLVCSTGEEKAGALALLKKFRAALQSGRHLQPLLRQVAESQGLPAEDFASLRSRMDATEDEAAIRTAVGALAGDEAVEQFLAWLRLGVSHTSTPPGAKPATQAVAKEAVRRACEAASKVRGPGDKAPLGEGVLVPAFLRQMRLVAERHSVTGPAAFFQIVQAALSEYQISLLLYAKEQRFKDREMSEDMLCRLLSEGCFTSWDAEAQAKGALAYVQRAPSETLSDAVTRVGHMFADLNAAHVPLTALDRVGPLLRLLTGDERKAFFAQPAVAALLDRSRLVSRETVEAMYQGVVDHLGAFARSPTWRFSKAPAQRAPAPGPASAEGGPSGTRQPAARTVPLSAPRGVPHPRGAFRPGASSVAAAAPAQEPSPPVDGAAPPDDAGPGADQPIAAVQRPLRVYCYTGDISQDRKETAYRVKNGLCLSCLHCVRSPWPDCPLHKRSARQNPRALPYTDQPASVDA
jgi:hypothetical protein